MSELKYSKYILDSVSVPEWYKKMHSKPESNKSYIAWLDGTIIEGAFHMAFRWYTEPKGDRGENHSHDFDEVLGFLGSDWENQGELNGEIELWLEDEKYLLTKSSLVFIPRGLKHLPLRVLKVDRPIIHFSMTNETTYSRV